MAQANNIRKEVERKLALENAERKLRLERERQRLANVKKPNALSRNALVGKLTALNVPALVPLRDALRSLSDPSFLNKKFNQDVYRELPQKVKNFLALPANQITRAVIISKIIEAVEIEKGASFNRGVAKALVNVAPKPNNKKPRVATTTTGTNAKPVMTTTTTGTNENNVLEIKITRTEPNDEMVSINLNNFNPEAKEIKLILPEEISNEDVIKSTIKLLEEGIKNPKEQMKLFITGLKTNNNNSSVVNITNAKSPNPETMAKIYKSYVLGNPISRDEIIYLEKGLFEMFKNAKFNNTLALTWETPITPSKKFNNSLQTWMGVNKKNIQNVTAKSKSKGRGILHTLTAAIAALFATRRSVLKSQGVNINKISVNIINEIENARKNPQGK